MNSWLVGQERIEVKGRGGGRGELGEKKTTRRTFNATSTACVLLTIPTTTLPCLTASDAYSTWKMRPWGELQRCISRGQHVSTRGYVCMCVCSGRARTCKR